MIRENRLYQADWLVRFYGFNVNELVGFDLPNLDLEIDPKLAWALRNLHKFPVDVNSADLELIKRIPGIGHINAQKIVAARKFRTLQPEDLQKMGVAYNRAKYFLAASSPFAMHKDYTPIQIKQQILSIQNSKYANNFSPQMALF